MRVLAFLLTALLVAPAVRAEDDGDVPADDGPTPDESVDETLRYVLTGQWLDPEGEFWAPRRGARTEISVLLGGEGSLGELGTLDRIPSIGGATVTVFARYYPVDRLAINLSIKGYLGVAEPAAGTAAETVVSPSAGVRWDLVREGRFSLLVDVQSGPAVFLFADVIGALGGAAWAIGGESQLGLSFRYSLGPWTAELRPFAGGRVGTANEIGRPTFQVGPFSALYLGADLGMTWSFLGDREPPPPPEHARAGG